MWALIVVQTVVIALLAVLVIGLLRSHAEILRRLHELGAGVYDDDADAARSAGGVTMAVELKTRPDVAEPRVAATPAFDVVGTTPAGRAAAVGVVGTDHATLLAFLSSGCGTCLDFWRSFAVGEANRLPGQGTRLVIVTKEADEESISAVQALAPSGLTTIMSNTAYAEYGVPVAPYFILVDGPSSRVVGEGAATTWAQVRHLLEQATADAGFALEGRSEGPGRQSGVARELRADDELLAAGIGPGHPSLYPETVTEPESE